MRFYGTLDFRGQLGRISGWLGIQYFLIKGINRMSVKTITFICPICGENRIEEIMAGVIVSSDVFNIVVEDGEADCDYGEQTNESGEVDHYQCKDCGHMILGARNLNELAAVLAK